MFQVLPITSLISNNSQYMAHHYAYMAKVGKVCEPESYAKATKDANWRAAMEEEMRGLAENDVLGMCLTIPRV